MDFGGHPYTFDHLAEYTDTAARLGFSALSVNDHLVFSVPWLDGPTALAAMIEHSGAMTLATTVSLPVVRGPVPLAKSLAAIDRLTGGRLIVAVGPGSSEKDYECVDVDFEERWARLDESIGALRALWRADGRTVRGPLLLDPGRQPRSPPDEPSRTADLGGELGLGCGASPDRASGRRLAGVGLQHDADRLRRGLDPAAGSASGPWQGSRQLPQRAGDHVVPHHRQPGRGRPRDAGASGADHPSPGGGPSIALCRSGRPRCSPRSSPSSPGPASSGSSYGPSSTRLTRSSGSGMRSARRSSRSRRRTI